MNEYIERGALLQKEVMVKKYYGDDGDFMWIEAVSHHDICATPAADVEPVVRCKRCVHKGPEVSIGRSMCPINGIFIVDDMFWCAHGKER